jgi:3-isopropylmalate/(R)-2-methylmalate dehydratase small subunit
MVTSPRGNTIPFLVNPTRRFQLLEGLDDLDVGLRRRDQIKAFQQADRLNRPWVYEIAGLATKYFPSSESEAISCST